MHNVNTKIQALLFALIFIFAPSVYSQQKVVILNVEKQHARVNVNKPTIYLSFERYGDDFIWLRLHNNSRWTINFRTDNDFYGLVSNPSTWSVGRDEFGLLDGAKVKPKYMIERLPDNAAINNFGCVSSQSWLPSGRSVIFEIPRENLTKPARLHIMFAYEWETEGLEPEHRVTFDAWDIPSVER